jgi:hypothetical protein
MIHLGSSDVWEIGRDASRRPFEYCSIFTGQLPGNNLPGIAFSIGIWLEVSDFFELAIDALDDLVICQPVVVLAYPAATITVEASAPARYASNPGIYTFPNSAILSNIITRISCGGRFPQIAN